MGDRTYTCSDLPCRNFHKKLKDFLALIKAGPRWWKEHLTLEMFYRFSYYVFTVYFLYVFSLCVFLECAYIFIHCEYTCRFCVLCCSAHQEFYSQMNQCVRSCSPVSGFALRWNWVVCVFYVISRHKICVYCVCVPVCTCMSVCMCVLREGKRRDREGERKMSPFFFWHNSQEIICNSSYKLWKPLRGILYNNKNPLSRSEWQLTLFCANCNRCF